MAKSKSTRVVCKGHVVHRPNLATCGEKKGKNSCRTYILVKNTKYAAANDFTFGGVSPKKVSVCPPKGARRNLEVHGPSGDGIRVTKIGAGKRRAKAGSWKNKSGKRCHTVCR